MRNIVLSTLEKLDLLSNITEVEVGESTKKSSGVTTSVIEASFESLERVKNSSSRLYIPSTYLTSEIENLNDLYIYFDLENYPFYQKAKEIILKEKNTKGVFRYRRTVRKGETESLLANDLFVLSSLLGEIKKLTVKRTNANVFPTHTIILIKFGEGKMAHVEYTISDHERIELEWSGDKSIIEFDSDEMRPIIPSNRTKLPLQYTVDSILKTSHKVDQNLVNKINSLKKHIIGGA